MSFQERADLTFIEEDIAEAVSFFIPVIIAITMNRLCRSVE